MKEIKKIFLVLIICLFMMPTIVLANKGSGETGTGGGGSGVGTSNGWRISGMGLRLTLYSYDGVTVQQIGSSQDFCTTYDCPKNVTTNITKQQGGKVAYQEGIYNLSWKNGKVPINSDTKFTKYYFGNDYEATRAGIEKYFGMTHNNINADNKTVFAKINKVFGTNIETKDANKIYMTVEPTVFINASKANNARYGTVYELANYYHESGICVNGTCRESGNSSNFGFVSGHIYRIIPNAIRSGQLNGTGDSYYNFVGDKKEDKVKHQNRAGDKATIAASLLGKTNKTAGFGIAVFWFVGQPETCSEICSGKSGDDLLACAENWCDENSTDTGEKKTCITNCNYPDPKHSSCPKTTKTAGKDTVCDSDTNSSFTECKQYDDSYYKVTCTEKSTIKYGDSLPTSILAGAGLTYTPTLSGNKVCKKELDVAKFKFDYATKKTAKERTALLKKLAEFNSVSDGYKYNSENATIKVTFKDKINGEEKKTTKTLVVSRSVGDGKINANKSNSNINLYANGKKVTENKVSKIDTNSVMTTYYTLPPVCFNDASGTLYDAKNNKCDTPNDGPYNAYFTDRKADKTTNNTSTSVEKGSSNLDVDNTCNYNVTDTCNLFCTITEETGTYKLNIFGENYNKVDLKYGLSDKGYEKNGKLTYTSNDEFVAVYGIVESPNTDCIAKCNNITTCTEKFDTSEKDKIKNYCDKYWEKDPIKYTSADDCYLHCADEQPKPTCKEIYKWWQKSAIKDYCNTNYADDREKYSSPEACMADCTEDCPTCLPSYNNCVELFEPTNYEAINSYCDSSWMFDRAGYTSPEICKSSCSDGNNTCKINSNFTCDEIDKVTTHCEANYSVDGYANAASCINDCYCGSQSKYIYRSVSLNDPFPNDRTAGSNWLGYESLITEDPTNPSTSTNTESEYVIELTPKIIKQINSDTKAKGKTSYVDYESAVGTSGGKYVSKFIHSSDFSQYFKVLGGK